MVINKRKKQSRARGSHTHGWGSMKKHRGAGSRGGIGAAGTGKRADTNKPSHWKAKYFGKFGFKNKNQKVILKPVTIYYIDEHIEKIGKKGAAGYEVSLSDLGFNKLLSNGKVNHKIKITTDYASKKAIEKIKKAGGDVILVKKEVKKAKAPEKEAKAKKSTPPKAEVKAAEPKKEAPKKAK
ncbi:MAG: 50S ribosomal protein L15 [bacterium]|nr:50S ribosomal protein L15 [bacterium]